MSQAKENEMIILKSVAFKLTDDLVCVWTYQYHTEQGHSDRAWYRNIAYIDSYETLSQQADDAYKFENRLKDWYWWDDPVWAGVINYSNDCKLSNFHSWLRSKLRKVIPYNDALAYIQGYNPRTGITSKKDGHSITGYTTQTGDLIDLTDLDGLIKLKGQSIWRDISRGSKRSKVKPSFLKYEKVFTPLQSNKPTA